MMDTTLCFLVRGNEVLLGLKKRGFGCGKWNGFGGKRADGETIEQAVVREMMEECNVKVNGIENVAELDFFFEESRKDWNQKVHVFVARDWEGLPIETEEMRPNWFPHDGLPFGSMWQDDPHWLPLVLDGKKVRARFRFADDNESIAEKEVGFMDDPETWK
jgi:8-oxo-dGTP pyrophosphatase MutT (NUDIX family)